MSGAKRRPAPLEQDSRATRSTAMKHKAENLARRLAALTALFVIGAAGARAQTPLSYYPGENNARDRMGRNDPAETFDVGYGPGVVGQAFYFNGRTGRISLTDPEELKLTGSMTLDLWIKAESVPRPDRLGTQIVFRGDERDACDPFHLTLLASGELQWGVESLTDTAEVRTPLPLRRWVHVLATLDDATGLLSLFLDDALVSQTVTIVRPYYALDETNLPSIGVGNHGGTHRSRRNMPFHGAIDELKIYNTCVRSTTADWSAVHLSVGADNRSRLLWRRFTGESSLWRLTPMGGASGAGDMLNLAAGDSWTATETPDGSQSGAPGADTGSQVMWTHQDGRALVRTFTESGALQSERVWGNEPGWSCVDSARSANGGMRLLWRHGDGRASVWNINARGRRVGQTVYGPFPLTRPVALAVGPDNQTRLLWSSDTHGTGSARLWTLAPNGTLRNETQFGPYRDWSAGDMAVSAQDNNIRLLWRTVQGRAALWTIAPNGAIAQQATFAPQISGGVSAALGIGPRDNKPRLLWNLPDGRASVWTLSATSGNLENVQTFGPL